MDFPKLIAWAHGGADTLYHWCPACERLHVIPPTGWTRTGTDQCPTYAPSFLQYSVRKFEDGSRGNCHYFIREGHLHYCADSWHGRSDVVPMPDIPISAMERLNGVVSASTDAVFKI